MGVPNFKKEYSNFRLELRRLYLNGQKEEYITVFAKSEFREVRSKKDNGCISLKINLYKIGKLRPELKSIRKIIY